MNYLRIIFWTAAAALLLGACGGDDVDTFELQTDSTLPDDRADVLVELRPIVPPVELIGEDGAVSRKFVESRSRRYDDVKEGLLQRMDLLGRVGHQLRTIPMIHLTGITTSERAALLAESTVVAIHEDRYLRTSLAETLPHIDQPNAENAGQTGAGTAVVVIDTGVDFTHSAFGTCRAAGSPGCRVVESFDIAREDGTRDDSSRHGTNVAGIVAGVAPGADIIGIDVFDGDRATVSDVLEAVAWSIDNQAAYDIVAVNMSLGGSRPYAEPCSGSPFEIGLAHAREVGILPVTSSGNDAETGGLPQPACAPSAVSVGAVYSQSYRAVRYKTCSDTDTDIDLVTCFSNSASYLDLLAPGVAVSAAGVTMSGTSQASPHVAGAVAVLRDVSPLASPDDVLHALSQGGKVLSDSRNDVSTPRLDVDGAAALLSCEPTISLAEDTFGADGGTTTLEVSASDSCPWTASVSSGWVELDQFQGTGTTTIEVTIDPNDGDERSALIAVDDVEVTLLQEQESQPSQPSNPSEPAEDAWVLIDGDAPDTSQRDVTLVLSADLDGDKPTRMCISNTTSCTDWQPYRESANWRLTEGAGTKTVWVWFLRGGNLLSAVLISDTIELVD